MDRSKPENFLRYEIDFLVGKKQLGAIFDKCIRKHGPQRSSEVLDAVKAQGYKYSTKGAITVAVCDATIPPKKKQIIREAEQQIDAITRSFKRGYLSEQDRYSSVIRIWEDATKAVTKALQENLDRYNPIYMMADSGARGTMSQIRQLAGMRGLIANTSGKTIEIPIRANYREGLNILEYFISSRGARKGLADTALRTADSGYLTRRLVDVSQEVIIREEDCGTTDGILVYDIRQSNNGDEVPATMEALLGNHLFENFYDAVTGDLLIDKNQILTERDVQMIQAADVREIRILPYQKIDSMRSRIIGAYPVQDVADPVTGDILAVTDQPISEEDADRIVKARIPSVTVKRTNDSGMEYTEECVSYRSSLIGQRIIDDFVDENGTVLLPSGYVLDAEDVEKILPYKPDCVRVVRETDKKSIIESMEERLIGRYLCEDCTAVHTGELLVRADKLMDQNDAALIANKSGRKQIKIRSIINCRAKHGICKKCYGSNLANGMPVSIGEAVGIIAAQSIGEPGTQLTMRTFHTGGVAGGEDITQGLPRVEELFEARKPKILAIVTELDGVVSIPENDDKLTVMVTGSEPVMIDGMKEPALSKTYSIPRGARLKVKVGQRLTKGDLITEGAVDPHDILRLKDPAAVQDYLIEEVQSAYRLQGVDINDKHIEVIIRQMMKKVRILDGGSTDLIAGTMVDKGELYAANEEIDRRTAEGEEGLLKATYSQTLLGITKASLATDSFLSAASFQETTRVLTDAATKGKVDPLLGLKENVIIGKLVPAGTGMRRYSEVEIMEAGANDFSLPETV